MLDHVAGSGSTGELAASNGLTFGEHKVSIFVALDGQICSNNYFINSMQQFKERLTFISNQKWG